MGVRPGLEQLHSFPEGRPSTKSAHFWCKESGGVRSTQHPGPTWVKEESPWGVTLNGGKMPHPQGEPLSSGPQGRWQGWPPTHTDSSLAPQRADLALLQSSRVGVRMK